jgi:hypothetical protein
VFVDFRGKEGDAVMIGRAAVYGVNLVAVDRRLSLVA